MDEKCVKKKEDFNGFVGWFIKQKISQLTPTKIARDPELSKEFLVQYGQSIKRIDSPYEEWSVLRRLEEIGENNNLNGSI